MISFDANDLQDCEKKTDINRKEIARLRWKILARAIIRSDKTSSRNGADDLGSISRFPSFNLFTSQPLTIAENGTAKWLIYTTKIFEDKYSINIRLPNRCFSALELIGFNNSGNICIWPSEEVLTYYCLCNKELFSGKSVLELGGGMTCLAGLMIAKHSTAVKVEVTDGNMTAIENVLCILHQNNLVENNKITCSVLQWSDSRELSSKTNEKYDIIISADCLFFDEERCNLVQIMWTLLKENGIIFVMAPQRNKTFYDFYKQAKMKGFICKTEHRYNDIVWNKHLELKGNSYYDTNIHYPILLVLTKSNKTLFWDNSRDNVHR